MSRGCVISAATPHAAHGGKKDGGETCLEVVTAGYNHKVIFSEIVPGHVTCQWLKECEESVDDTMRSRGGGVFRSTLHGLFSIGCRARAAA